MDVDDSMDQSMMSQATAKPKATKKGTKGKGKSSKSKKENVEVESQMDVDEIELVQPEPEPAKPKRGKGKKRVSEEMNNNEPESVQEEFYQPPPPAEPPAKRRATKTRSSSVSQAYEHDHVMADAGSVDEAPQEEETAKKGRKKKGTSSKSRKASDVSVSSKATSKTRVPRDSELDAALEAGLDADVPESLEAEQETEPEPEKPRASKKTKGGKKAKATAKSPEPPQEPEYPADDQEEQPKVDAEPDAPEMEEPEVPKIPEESEEPVPKSKTTKTSKKKGSKRTKKEENSNAPAMPDLSEFKSAAEDRRESERHESFVSVEIINTEPESRREPGAEPAEKAVPKKSSKKDVKAKKSKKTKKAEETPPPEPAREERDFRSPSRYEDVFGTPDDIPDQVEMVAAPQAPTPEPPVALERTPVPAKTAKRFSDIPQEEHLAQSFSESQGSGRKERSKPQRTSQSSNRAVSPLPVVRLSTPSMSPQSSDAENHPPSSRPSTARPAEPSASKMLKTRTPLAASTPSPSRRNANAGFPPSAHPWTPVDIDEVLFGEASDKENADLTGNFKNLTGNLTSPEKKMTVEEWIMWNAKNGEERLKRECERLVGQFEKEGGRAMRRLEAIECMD